MKSVGAKIEQIAGLHDTSDVNEWENNFIASVVESTCNGRYTRLLSEKQLDAIDRIWRKHFAG